MTWMNRARWIVIGIVASVLFGVVIFSRVITDWLWFQHLGYPGLFTQPIAWRFGVGAAAGVAAALFLWLNLRLTKGVIAQAFLRLAQHFPVGLPWRRVSQLTALGSALIGVLLGGAVSESWQVVAQGLNAEPFGVADPLFGRDVSFFVFTLPWLNVIKGYAFGLLLVTALLVGGVYLASGAFQIEGRTVKLAPGPRVHLSLLLALIAAVKAWDYSLAAYELVYSTRGAIYGAAYTDVHASLPAYRILTVIALAVAGGMVVNAFRPALRFAAAGIGLLLAASVLVGGVYPALVQQYVVRPNELDRELPYIESHLQMTRAAYALGRITEREFEPALELGPSFVEEHAGVLENVRLWDWRPLLDTYAQLQELRPYYDFIEVDIDRYVIDGEYRQVMLAARELTTASLQNQAWVNRHLQYTHGYGLVMSPVNRVTPQGLPEFIIQNIPPESRGGLVVTRPEIYYGEQEADYVVVKTRRPEFDYGSGDQNVTTFYEGEGGVPLGGWLRRLAFAARVGTLNLLLSRDITAESRVMLYRTIDERVRRLAPFLRYDSDPYLVLAEGRLFWIIDAYTSSSRYPYAAPVRGWGNYARNPVKVVIDAYHGSVDFYLLEEEPVITVWSRIFPGVFKDGAEMPAELRKHIRYPEDLFRLQASVLTRYHIKNPQVFYNSEDVWELPREVVGEREVMMDPYYAILQLPDADAPEFVLLLPFTPVGKGNMIAWLAARNDGERYGEMILYHFGKQEVTLGPRQFEARIDQDPEISSQLTLWSQQGSRVIRGNLLVIPVGPHLLYVEPIYLQAEQSPMPEFVRVVVGDGRDLVMARTFEQALAQLIGADTAPRPSAARERAAPTDAGEATLTELVDEALAHFERAQRSAAAGDWTAYGQALDALSAALERLKSETGSR